MQENGRNNLQQNNQKQVSVHCIRIMESDHSNCLKYPILKTLDPNVPSVLPENHVYKDRLIGRGSYGFVWAATDPRSGVQVALKKLSGLNCKQIQRYAVRELLMLTNFDHDNVISSMEIIKPLRTDTIKDIFFITELLHYDLHQVIIKSDIWTNDIISRFLYQILRGCKYLHSANIIHCDLKPSNIFVTIETRLKIGDFGLARAEVLDPSRQLNRNIATMWYRPPEILLPGQRYTKAVDMWAIGCILAEMIARKPLLPGNTEKEQLNLIINLFGTPISGNMRVPFADVTLRQQLEMEKQKKISAAFYALSSKFATINAVNLLCNLLVLNPEHRFSVSTAIKHPYLRLGNLTYHYSICKCCETINGRVQNVRPIEPEAGTKYDDSWELRCKTDALMTQQLRSLVEEHLNLQIVHLRINPQCEPDLSN